MTSENSSRVEASGRDGGLCLGRGFDIMAKEGRLDKGVILAEHERWLDPEREREKAPAVQKHTLVDSQLRWDKKQRPSKGVLSAGLAHQDHVQEPQYQHKYQRDGVSC